VRRHLDRYLVPFGPIFQVNTEQIQRVEQLSDAYHLTPCGDDVMVAYLVEITHRAEGTRCAA
jgi:hypothetical protein